MLVFFLISFIASTIGAVCGLGGGIMIKPVMDLASGLGAAQINFLSGCTVLCMSCVTLVKRRGGLRKNADAELVLLALGSAVGGIAGKLWFDAARKGWDPATVSVVQSSMIAALCVIVLIYMLRKAKIKTLHLKNKPTVAATGLGLGLLSAFLGIGGGPFNILVLSYFFSMETQRATLASIFIIFFAQVASLGYTLVSGVPGVDPLTLLAMVLGGATGGIVGAQLCKKCSDKQTDAFFSVVVVLIILISGYNVVRVLL